MNNSKRTNILHLRIKNVSWQKQVQKGKYMKGAIKAAKGAICTRCQQTSFASMEDDFLNFNVPKCTACLGPPSKLRVVKYVPGGKEYLYTGLDGLPLTKISHAMGLIGKINDDLKNGTYKPKKYNQKNQERLKFCNYAREYIEHCDYRLTLPFGHEDYLSAGGHLKKVSMVKNELTPHFKETPIDTIQKLNIMGFAKTYTTKFRTRDLALGELKTMLRLAFNEFELITTIPAFPKIAKARQRRSEEIPTKEIQIKIINQITEPKYRAMWIIAASLAKRPCEVRAYKVCDIDLVSGLIYTRRHFTKGLTKGEELIDGRKSIGMDEELGSLVNKLDQRLIEIIAPFLKGKKQDDYLFEGERVAYVSSTALWEAWRRACKRIGVNYQPYVGTKSSTATDMVKKGKSIETIRAFLGHKHSKQSETYAKIAAIDTEDMIDSSVFKWEFVGA